jgi:6-phosphogluconolactonase
VRLIVAADAEEAGRMAADAIAQRCRAAVAARGRACVALSGGGTPRPMLLALARCDLPWDAVHVAQVDERAVPTDDPRRNVAALRSALVDAGPLPASNLHVMRVDTPGSASAAADYAAELASFADPDGGLDLVQLGLGSDGHTASLVPNDEVLRVADRDVAWTGAPYQGTQRMTLTYRALDRAAERLWLVTGRDKSAALALLQRGHGEFPARHVRRSDSVIYADRAAAKQLSRT